MVFLSRFLNRKNGTKSPKAFPLYFNALQYFTAVFIEYRKELTLKGTLKRNYLRFVLVKTSLF